ncbi:MAG: CpaF family protein [Deltaproteobacteria bacterium]|nr:CpaF family protein [Deltaproteobacteria bacterium]
MIPAGIFKNSIKGFLLPISSLMNDETVSEIMINGPDEIWAERKGKLTLTDCAFPCSGALDAALTNIAQFSGRHIGEDRPILEAHLPDGSRVEAVLPPLAENGPVVAIRRFSKSDLTVARLVEFGTLTGPAVEFLAQAVASKKNVVVSGGTGSGKTSLLGALSSLIPDGERIVVIEDTREVQLQKSHVVYLETRSADERGRGRITIRDLLKATLRLRPDRIVVGEVRGGEALDLIQAMTSGHGGSMTTAHANTPADTVRRLETMAMMADTGLPLPALRAQVASAVELIVQIERVADGRRLVSEITRVVGEKEGEGYVLEKAFYRERGHELVRAQQRKGGE